MTRISVLIPAYNAAGTIERTLHALDLQTYSKKLFEVIVVDDGSKDDTAEIVEKYKKQAKYSLTLLSKPNSGPGPARNMGLEIAKGEIIAYTDADCIPDTDWLETIATYMQDKKYNLLGGEVYCEDTIIYPWKASPAGQQRITANAVVRVSAAPGLRFDEKYQGLNGDDTDYINRIETLRSENKYYFIKSIRVQHPVNIFSLRQVINKAASRINEFLLLQTYGPGTYSFMNPMYKPILLDRISPLPFIVFIPIIICLAGILSGQYLMLSVIFIAFTLIFVLWGYKALSPNLRPGDKINFRDRIKTLFYLLVYNFTYLIARIKGSIKYKNIKL